MLHLKAIYSVANRGDVCPWSQACESRGAEAHEKGAEKGFRRVTIHLLFQEDSDRNPTMLYCKWISLSLLCLAAKLKNGTYNQNHQNHATRSRILDLPLAFQLAHRFYFRALTSLKQSLIERRYPRPGYPNQIRVYPQRSEAKTGLICPKVNILQFRVLPPGDLSCV